MYPWCWSMSHCLYLPLHSYADPDDKQFIQIIGVTATVAIVICGIFIAVTYFVTKKSMKDKLKKSSSETSTDSQDSCEVHWFKSLWFLISTISTSTVNSRHLFLSCLVERPDNQRASEQQCWGYSSKFSECFWVVQSTWLSSSGNQEWVSEFTCAK